MIESDGNIDRKTTLVIKALGKLLRPFVRLLIHYQVTLPMLSDLLKSVYVDVAKTDFKIPDKRMTDSRISVLTGVHRKDVRKIRVNEARNDDEPETVSLGTQAVSIWMSNPKYIDNQGKPKPLPKKSASGDVSFETLIQLVGKNDIHARSVLDDWLRLGVVHLNEAKEVVLLHEAFVPDKGFDEKVYFFGQNMHDHMAAITNNLIGESDPFLERTVYYSGLSDDSVCELQSMATEYAMRTLKEVDKKARSLKKLDLSKNADNRSLRFNFGTYFFKEKAKDIEGDENG